MRRRVNKPKAKSLDVIGWLGAAAYAIAFIILVAICSVLYVIGMMISTFMDIVWDSDDRR